MRVVAGTARGRRLLGPASAAVRPTTDKVREAIFNALNSLGVVEGARVADLFAGTGACGIEALSRGADSAVFVDSDRRSIETIRANLAATGFVAEVIRADAVDFVRRDERDFDLLFADPPYEFDRWKDLLAAATTTAVAVCESDRFLAPVEGWDLVRERRYGGTCVTILERAG